MAKRTRAGWAKLVREWRESGEPTEVFASRRGVKAKTLQWWAWNLGSAALDASRPLEVIEVVQTNAVVVERFEVHLANGRCVGVPPAFDADALRLLLSVVDGAR